MERMTEKTALALLRQGDEAGLRWMMQQYAPYVGSIARSIAGDRSGYIPGALAVQDEAGGGEGEELHRRHRPQPYPRSSAKSGPGAAAGV